MRQQKESCPADGGVSVVERLRADVANAKRIKARDNGLIWIVDPADIELLIEAFEVAQDKIDGLDAELNSAVEVAFRRGALTWTRDNYPTTYARLMRQFESQSDRSAVAISEPQP